MKEQLISLAKEKEFESSVIGKSVNAKYSSKPFYYLWMCELQKWLREEHRINVESNYLPNIQKYRCLYVPMTKAIPNREKYSLRSKYYGIDNHETYEQALEEGLLEALKLIP